MNERENNAHTGHDMRANPHDNTIINVTIRATMSNSIVIPSIKTQKHQVHILQLVQLGPTIVEVLESLYTAS